MAKKRTSGKTKSFSEAIGLQYIFNNTITDFFLGLALLVVAVVMILAMISFLSTGAADQSLLENMQPGEWTNTQQLFQNYCGSIGAILSYWLMAVNFGFPAFLIPCFVVMVGFQLMNVYRVNLWKWFFCMMVVMIWSSVTFAKFLTPIFGSLIFNPGGKHGMFVVQTLENVIGPPGLTAILLFVAIAFLTYITTETITIVRKALNPIGYISNKVKFEITNHKEKQEEDDAIDEAYRNAAQGTVQDEEMRWTRIPRLLSLRRHPRTRWQTRTRKVLCSRWLRSRKMRMRRQPRQSTSMQPLPMTASRLMPTRTWQLRA